MPGCEVGWANLCLDDIDWAWPGVVVEALLLLYSFVAVAVIADSHLVVSLETLCVRWGVREDVAGASFMAFGSAAPEIIINAISTFKAVVSPGHAGGSSDDTAMGVGAIIGSGMIAFTVIPGACGLFAKDTLQLKRRPLARDVGFYALALLALCGAFADSVIVLPEAAALVALYGLYMLLVVCSSRIRQLYRVRCLGREVSHQESFVTQASSASDLGAVMAAASPSLAAAAHCQPQGEPHPAAAPPSLHEGDRNAGIQLTLPAQPAPQPFLQFDAPSAFAAPAGAAREGQCFCITERALALAGRVGSVVLRPLLMALSVSCPECSHDSPHAHKYPVTLATSFLWVAMLSTVISAVVSRWGELLGVPSCFLGMCVIAVGAEIPDTIQSVTVARRGYGSMAVSNSTGSQILNILVGLGMPWLISCLAGRPVRVRGHGQLEVMAYFQAANVSVYSLLILFATACTWRRGDHSKASLGRHKGATLVGTYLLAISSYTILTFGFK